VRSSRCSAARQPRGRSRRGRSSASGFTRLKSPGTSLPKMGGVSNLMTLVLILIAGLMGTSGVVLAAAAAHAKSGMGLDGAGYLLLFHAVAVLSGVALLQQCLAGGCLAAHCLLATLPFALSSATHYFPWRRRPAESYSFWRGSRSLWLPFWRCCTASLVGQMTGR